MDVCIQFGWIAIILYLIKCRGKSSATEWTLSMDSMDIVHGLSGHCPWTEWILSMDWVDKVHGLSGHCPLTQWTLSMDSVDIVHGPSFQYSSWTMSTESMDFLQTGRSNTPFCTIVFIFMGNFEKRWVNRNSLCKFEHPVQKSWICPCDQGLHFLS